MPNNNARPFLKWAGGKTQLLDQFQNYYPTRLKEGKITKYVEPFVGGGAVFFHLQSKYEFKEVILNDINEEIILTYKIIRDNVDELLKFLSNLQNEYYGLDIESKEKMFYEQRDKFNIEKLEINYNTPSEVWICHAARMIFLNKTCFNGLFRLNRKGQYNVPFGKHKTPTICDSDNLKAVHIVLQGSTLICGDFEKLIEYVDKDTFIYADPPYRPLNITSSFNDYSKDPFNDSSQIRLANWCDELHKIGASFMLSNSDPTNTNPEDHFFDELYEKFTINRVIASRSINSKGSGRGKLKEILVVNEAINNFKKMS